MFDNFYKNKRIFITGSTGFKGSWLSLWLLELGADVKGYSLPAPTNPSLFEKAKLSSHVNTVIADVRDQDRFISEMSEFQPEIVIHLAAQPLVRLSYREPYSTYEINVMGTVNLFEAVRKCDSVKAVLNVTTDKCYENKEWLWGYRENEPLGGYDPYSNSKACSELVTSAYRNSFFNQAEYNQKHHVALASARAGNVIGGGDWAEDRLIPDIINSFQVKKEVLIRSPYAIRPWQHVLESLHGYLLLCKKLYECGCSYAEGWNFGPDDNDAQNVEWIVKRLCALWGNGAAYRIDDSPQLHEANYLKLDISKSKTLLKWKPLTDIEFALKNIVSCYLEFDDIKDYCIHTIKQFERLSEND